MDLKKPQVRFCLLLCQTTGVDRGPGGVFEDPEAAAAAAAAAGAGGEGAGDSGAASTSGASTTSADPNSCPLPPVSD